MCERSSLLCEAGEGGDSVPCTPQHEAETEVPSAGTAADHTRNKGQII